MTYAITMRRAALAATALITGLTLAACGGHDSGDSNMPGVHQGGASSKAGATFNNADTMFAQAMIPHHQQAVEMAELAETRAADPELKRLASQIRAAQDPEIKTMTAWLTSWGQPTMMPSGGHDMGGMHGGMPGMMSDADMAKLKASTGKDFDKQFVQMMIDHHKGAIQMAKDEQANGSDPDAKALAGRIIESQQAEIDSMQKMLAGL
jgi:uncharacterized protein (DUF305 family)